MMKAKIILPLLAASFLSGVVYLRATASKSPTAQIIAPVSKAAPASVSAPLVAADAPVTAEELERALTNNELGVAETILQNAVPSSALALEGRPKLLMRENNIAGAKAALAACLEKLPKSYACLSTRVEAEMSSGSPEALQAAAQDCLKVFPSDPACRNWLGMIELSDGNGKNAVKIYQTLLEEKAPTLEPRYLAWQLAKAEELSGDTKAARVYYSRACKLKNLNACAWIESRR